MDPQLLQPLQLLLLLVPTSGEFRAVRDSGTTTESNSEVSWSSKLGGSNGIVNGRRLAGDVDWPRESAARENAGLG